MVLFAAGCGAAKPMPTLEDYSHGVSPVVRGIEEYFFEGGMREGAAAPASLGDGEGAGALAELSRRWRSSCATGCASAGRIVDLQKKSSSFLSLRLEVRLEGLGSTEGPERVASLGALRPRFRAADRCGPVDASGVTSRRRSRAHSARPAASLRGGRGAWARSPGTSPSTRSRPRTSACPRRTIIRAFSSWTWTATARSTWSCRASVRACSSTTEWAASGTRRPARASTSCRTEKPPAASPPTSTATGCPISSSRATSRPAACSRTSGTGSSGRSRPSGGSPASRRPSRRRSSSTRTATAAWTSSSPATATRGRRARPMTAPTASATGSSGTSIGTATRSSWTRPRPRASETPAGGSRRPRATSTTTATTTSTSRTTSESTRSSRTARRSATRAS